jgi:magnesium chelatase family protein
MLAKLFTCAVIGLDGAIVEVEVDISPGLPLFAIVGLADTAVQESKERVRSAIRNSGGTFPLKRIAVNLAPANLKKAGPAYDLSIALGILISTEQLQADVRQIVFLGELALTVVYDTQMEFCRWWQLPAKTAYPPLSCQTVTPKKPRSLKALRLSR